MMDDQRAQRAIICCRFLDISTAVIGACPGAAGLMSHAVTFYDPAAIRTISKLFFINSIIRGAQPGGRGGPGWLAGARTRNFIMRIVEVWVHVIQTKWSAFFCRLEHTYPIDLLCNRVFLCAISYRFHYSKCCRSFNAPNGRFLETSRYLHTRILYET